MRALHVVTATAISAGLVVAAPMAAVASEADPADPPDPGTAAAVTTAPPADEDQAEEAAPAATAPADAAPEDAPPADAPPADAADPTDLPPPAGAVDTAPADPLVAPDPADRPDEAASEIPADPENAAPLGLEAFSALAAEASAVYPDPDYHPHWNDGTEEEFYCDYWYFLERPGAESGKDWSGWGGQPQLHILHHQITDDDGTVRMVYDRDIAGSWFHAWSGDETVSPDPDGIHWENTAAQQTVLVNGYRGGSDLASRGADAQALLERAGVQLSAPEYLTGDELNRYYDYTAYEATQFAVWYFSTGHDVMGLFFDVDEANHVTLSQQALDQFDHGAWDDWGINNYYSDRMAVLETAAWLIEQALTTNAVMPQPGFVSEGYVRNADGSTDYGFTATLVGGTGDVHVELRTADGSAVPAGVQLVDASGRVIDSVTPGQRVYIRIPSGMQAADLPAFQLWGSAQGTEPGSPYFYTGWDRNNNGMLDPDTGEWIYGTFQHWFIGLGELDRAATAWDWIGLVLAEEPEAPVDPTDPTDPTDPADPADPADPVDRVVPPAPGGPAGPAPADPVVLGADGTLRALAGTTTVEVTDLEADAAAPERDALAQTGTESAPWLAAGVTIILAGTGLVLARRHRRTEQAD